MGIVSKGSKCNVDSCDSDAVRSLNTKKVGGFSGHYIYQPISQ